ncbi:MAG: hypothetical protein R2736_02620 [Solirubrobacterales bacterium]
MSFRTQRSPGRHWNHQTAVETRAAALAAMHAIENEIGRERLYVLDLDARGRPRPRDLEALCAFLELEPGGDVIRRAGSLGPAWYLPLSAEADGLVAQTRDATLEAWCQGASAVASTDLAKDSGREHTRGSARRSAPGGKTG